MDRLETPSSLVTRIPQAMFALNFQQCSRTGLLIALSLTSDFRLCNCTSHPLEYTALNPFGVTESEKIQLAVRKARTRQSVEP